MILELEVKGFALVDHLVLEFGPGLTVMTGETGAGKSIILDSLSFLLGTVPKGMDKDSDCRIAGRFTPSDAVDKFLSEQGLPLDEEELIIVRERKAGGRTSSRLNGSIVSVSQLQVLSELLLDLHSQHQSYGLMKPSTHLPLLDKMAGGKHQAVLQSYQELYSEHLELKREMSEIRSAERERLRTVEWLRSELEEIENVAPQVGEDLSLEAEIKKRAAAEELSYGCSRAHNLLAREDGVLDDIFAAISALVPLQSFDLQLVGAVERMQAAEIELREVQRELEDYLTEIEHDPQSLDELQRRSEAIRALCRKYGPTLNDVIEHKGATLHKLDRLENSEQHLQVLGERVQRQQQQLQTLADKMSKSRRKAAAVLGAELVSELAQLAMPKVAFEVEFQVEEEFGPRGTDRAQFLFSPNPGREPTPLADTASGGELSRVMLALVSILSRFQQQPTLVFDEIDVGLGGRTAEAVAGKLARLGKSVQVICVTHLPVVAAAGSGHLVVEKSSGKGQTKVTVSEVTNQDRISEVARMLSGDASKHRARELASELLAQHG